MSVKSFLALADDKLHEVFSKKEYDPAKDRAAMIKRLDTAKYQFASATPTKGKKMFKIANGVVELALPFEIAGKSTFHIPSERFADAIGHLKEAIGKGEADEALKGGSVPAIAGEKPARAARKPRDPDAPAKAGWSDERRAAFAATIAARKAGK